MKEKSKIYTLKTGQTFETHSGEKFELVKYGKEKRVKQIRSGKNFLLSEFERTILTKVV